MDKTFQISIPNSRTVKCTACKYYCTIIENGFGFCGARKNEKGKIIITTHSKPCSLNLDPIEKKPLFHYLPGSETLSIGFFGCNFKCDFCQNWEISFVKGNQAEKTSGELKELSPKNFVDLALKKKAKSVAFTYNEQGNAITLIRIYRGRDHASGAHGS